MKKIISTLIASCMLLLVIAQAPPQGINYQAVAIDFSNAEIPGTDAINIPVKNEAIKVRFSIIKDQITGVTAYQEEHTTTTDQNGLFQLIIGTGFQLSTDAFSDIDWSTGYHYLKVEIDISGSYLEMGTQQLWSVPYALYSEKAGNGIQDILDNGDGTATFIFENGITYTTNNMAGPQGPVGPQGPQGPQGVDGPQGPAGADGNGIVNTIDNGDGTLTFVYDDGSTFTTPNLEGPQGPVGPQGPQGPQGADGNGIVNTIDNGDGTLTFVYDDGSTFTTPNLEGPQGPAGPQGAQGNAGPQGIPGNNGISLNWLGTLTVAPGSPSLNDAYYNSNDGISYVWDGSSWQIIAQDGMGGGGGANTLDQAYDEGGAGSGRIITADNGAVEINNAAGNTTALTINTPEANSFGLDATNTNTGVAIRGQNTNASNGFPAIQAETNSTGATNSALLAQNTGGGYAVAGQIPSTASGTAAVYGNNLRTTGGSGVSGIGLNGVVGESTNGAGYGLYGNNPTGVGLAIGTYGIGLNGIYGQTTNPATGWAGYFTADVGIDGSVFALGAGNFNLSDQRLKTNINPIESALSKIIQLNGKYYTITTKHRGKDGEAEERTREEYGVIAQEVEVLFPEMIEEKAIFSNVGDDTLYKAVNYQQLIPVLIEAIKELNGKVESLEEVIEEIQTEQSGTTKK